MSDILNALRAANPGLPLYDVRDAEFAPYGRLLPLSVGAAQELSEALAACPIPCEGNRYEAGVPALEGTAAVRGFARTVFGGMDIQAGYCNGRGHTLNALEYHKCPEVNFSDTGLVLLLARPGDIDDGRLDSSCVVGFLLPPGLAVEIHPLVLHFAPCRVTDGGFRSLVVLENGVNSPLPAVDTSAPDEEKLLWMRGKWLTCHPDSPQAAKGAYAGISGENLELNK